MSVYKRGRTYHYRFMYRGVPYRGSTKETKEQPAKTYESLLLAHLHERGSIIKKSPRLTDFSAQFKKDVQASRLSLKTRLYYNNGVRLLETSRLATLPLDRITRQDAESLDFGSPSNTNNALRTLSKMLTSAKDKKLIHDKPKIPLAKERRRSSMLTAEWEAKLLPVARQPLRDVIVLMRDTGLRNIRELFRVRIEHLDWKRHRILVPSSKTAAGEREAPMSERCRQILVARTMGRSEGFVFPSKRSACGHLTTVQKQWEAAKEVLAGQKVKLPDDLVLYCARHDFGTSTYKATKNLFAVMKAMGHSDIKSTMQYQHQEIDEIHDAVNGRLM